MKTKSSKQAKQNKAEQERRKQRIKKNPYV